MIPVAPLKPKFQDLMRNQIRLRHYTELQYLQWVKQFNVFDNKRYPVDIGVAEVYAYGRTPWA